MFSRPSRNQLFGFVSLIILTIPALIFRISVPDPGSNKEISYSEDVAPILESRCTLCHGGQWTRDRLDLRSYATLMEGSNSGPVIVPGNADESLLIVKIRKGEMPKRGPRLFPRQLRVLVQWINAGAPNN